MSTTNQNDDTDDINNLQPKKELKIQPLNPGATLNIHGANEDLLAELRQRTAELANQIQGHEDPLKRVLKLNNASVTDEDVVAALKEETPHENTQKKEEKSSSNPAVELVRQKLAKLYKKEPDAADEAIEAYEAGNHRSKHQKFMYELTTSGKSLADIQTQWHNYYTGLPDDEKHQVWTEFYETQSQNSKLFSTQGAVTHQKPIVHHLPHPQHKKFDAHQQSDTRTVGEIKTQLYDKINAKGRLSVWQHVKSLLFGLSMAALVGLIITFTFFNEVFIAPFISPSRSVSATPIIGTTTGSVGPEPKIIIPKINLEVPVVFGMSSVEEDEVQKSLENGVVHYATTPNPGEKGNSVIVGHSSNNILNSGKYKFAFVLLKRLEAEDTFFVQKDGIRYTYKVYKKEIISPDYVDILQTQERENTITLITCDPPGTSVNRLIIVAEQISPDPSGNIASTAKPVEAGNIEKLPSNAPSLWSRIWPF